MHTFVLGIPASIYVHGSPKVLCISQYFIMWPEISGQFSFSDLNSYSTNFLPETVSTYGLSLPFPLLSYRSATIFPSKHCGVRSLLPWWQHLPYAPSIHLGTAVWFYFTWSFTPRGISLSLCHSFCWAYLVVCGELYLSAQTLPGVGSVRPPNWASILS